LRVAIGSFALANIWWIDRSRRYPERRDIPITDARVDNFRLHRRSAPAKALQKAVSRMMSGDDNRRLFMKGAVAVAVGSLFPALGDAAEPGEVEAMRADVVFTVIFRKDGEFLAAPTVLAEFGRELSIEIPEVMRAQVLATAPDQEGRSFTSAKLAIFRDGAWQPPKEMSMEAQLAMTPSFEYSVADAPYRFVVMPRSIVPVSSDGKYLAISKTETVTKRAWQFK
jgi:hypothetical protein